MSTPGAGTRSGFRLPPGRLFPVAGIVVGAALVSATLVIAGQDSSSGQNTTGIVSADSAVDPAAVPAAGHCTLLLDGARRDLTILQARTLTQVAAVGWQVKAPEDMVARVLDTAAKSPGTSPSVTDTLDLFTREDADQPTNDALADVRALSVPGALTCAFDTPTGAAEKKGAVGLTPRADAIRRGVTDAFGKLALAGFGAKAKAETGAESAGRALTVQVPAAFTPADGHGWVIAHWLAARGADYRLDAIAFGDRIWAPSQGWQAVTPGTAEATQARADRIYVSVVQGIAAVKAPAKDSKSEKKKAEAKKATKKKAAKKAAAKKKSSKRKS